VLITDEVLAVGDESFQKKCIAWMENYLADGGTLLLCSHSMYHIQKLCKQAVWIDQGRIREQGSSADVTRNYLAWHEEKGRLPDASANTASGDKAGIYHVTQMSLNGLTKEHAVQIELQSDLTVSGEVHSPDGRTPHVAVGIVRADGTPVYGIVSEMDQHALKANAQGVYPFEIIFKHLPLLPGRYVARTHAMDPEGMRLFDHVEQSFDVLGVSREMGYVHLAHHWVKK
jgi:lipopolysaccharide transport system ATP-binding protein